MDRRKQDGRNEISRNVERKTKWLETYEENFDNKEYLKPKQHLTETRSGQTPFTPQRYRHQFQPNNTNRPERRTRPQKTQDATTNSIPHQDGVLKQRVTTVIIVGGNIITQHIDRNFHT